MQDDDPLPKSKGSNAAIGSEGNRAESASARLDALSRSIVFIQIAIALAVAVAGAVGFVLAVFAPKSLNVSLAFVFGTACGALALLFVSIIATRIRFESHRRMNERTSSDLALIREGLMQVHGDVKAQRGQLESIIAEVESRNRKTREREVDFAQTQIESFRLQMEVVSALRRRQDEIEQRFDKLDGGKKSTGFVDTEQAASKWSADANTIDKGKRIIVGNRGWSRGITTLYFRADNFNLSAFNEPFSDRPLLPAPISRSQPPNPCEYRVWFGTDRRLVRDGDFSLGFLDEYSDTLRCGSCVVYVPKSHEFASTGSSLIARIVKRITGQKADEPLRLLAIEAGTPESLVQDLRGLLGQLPKEERDLALFIHGYNVDFNDAAIRAAQVGRDLELPGPLVFYSWPSKASLKGFSADEATIDRTIPKFLKFLDVLLAIPEASAINVIAHSMGNRLFQRAMQILNARDRASDRRFGHVVLAAADIDRETFRQAALDYSNLKATPRHRTTAYFNYDDRAVRLSKWIHQESRAGTQGKDLPGTDSILWIDSWFSLDWLGHSYFCSAAPVLKDIQALLLYNKEPKERQPPLMPVPGDFPQYWELKR